MIPCVILASSPRRNAQTGQLIEAVGGDGEAFQSAYADFLPGMIRKTPLSVQLHDGNGQDGGNGTGRETAPESSGAAMNPVIGTLGKTFWDFAVSPQTESRDARFPPVLRFELCLFFTDIGQAQHYLTKEAAGQRVCRTFQFVEIVALSVPAYASTPGKGEGFGG